MKKDNTDMIICSVYLKDEEAEKQILQNQAIAEMEMEDRVKLWDAINEYVIACGGDPSSRVYGNTSRMNAVAKVESFIREMK